MRVKTVSRLTMPIHLVEKERTAPQSSVCVCVILCVWRRNWPTNNVIKGKMRLKSRRTLLLVVIIAFDVVVAVVVAVMAILLLTLLIKMCARSRLFDHRQKKFLVQMVKMCCYKITRSNMLDPILCAKMEFITTYVCGCGHYRE